MYLKFPGRPERVCPVKVTYVGIVVPTGIVPTQVG